MKRAILLLNISLSFILSLQIAHADRQASLDAVFNGTYSLVLTFDNEADWTGVGETGKTYADSPDFVDGRGLIGYQYECGAGTHKGPWLSDHGEYAWSGKSLRLSYQNFIGNESYDCGYGPQTAVIYFGSEGADSRNTGWDEVYVFYMIKFSHTNLDLITTPYDWIATGTNNEYYLRLSGGDPGLLPPNQLIINGTWVEDPLISGEDYTNLGDDIGTLANDKWAYGDPATLGYSTIVVKLADGTDPDTKSANYIQYESGFFTMNGNSATVANQGVIKHLAIHQGFWFDHTTSPYYRYYDSTGDTACSGVFQEWYGINFSIFNITHDTDYGDLTFKGQWNSAYLDTSCYKYNINDSDVRWPNNVGMLSRIMANEWIGVEFRVNKGTCGSANSITRLWVYDQNGNELLSNSINDNHLMCGIHDLPMNLIHIGGNKIGTVYPYDAGDTFDDRYYIDDLIVHNSRVGPTYFTLLTGSQATPTLSGMVPAGLKVNQ